MTDGSMSSAGVPTSTGVDTTTDAISKDLNGSNHFFNKGKITAESPSAVGRRPIEPDTTITPISGPNDLRIDATDVRGQDGLPGKTHKTSSTNYGLAIFTPHPYLDVSKLRPEYDRIPSWLFYARELLADNAVAVVATFPADLEAIKTLLLPAAGFHGPTTVVPARLSEGLDLAHSEILVVARRRSASAPIITRASYELLNAVTVGESLVQADQPSAMHFFASTDGNTKRAIEEGRIRNWFRVRGRSNWAPWED
jgi:hypothetical protein